MIKRSGPRMEPCGTPHFSGKNEKIDYYVHVLLEFVLLGMN